MISANDWASPDPSMNMVLADADRLGNELAGGLCLQFGDVYIRTTQNQIIPEAELRANPYISPLPVNLFTHLAVAGSIEINLAQFKAQLMQAATSDSPISSLIALLTPLLPQTNLAAMFTRIPAVQQVIATALAQVN
jgi:hypothetical protein